jgi:hypothetical protein
MKTKIVNNFLSCTVLLAMCSCHKTYTCKCTYPNNTATYSTGQVKAISAKKAEKQCSGTCSGGIVSVK